MDQAEFAAHPMFQNATVRWDESGIPLPLPEVTRRNLFRRAALLVVLIVFTQLYWHGPKTFWSVDAPYSESRYMPPFYQQVQGAHWETFFADVTAALADPPQGVYAERAADRDVHFLEGEGVLQELMPRLAEGVASYIFTDEAMAIGPGGMRHRTTSGQETARWEDMVNVKVSSRRNSDDEIELYHLHLRDGRSWSIDITSRWSEDIRTALEIHGVPIIRPAEEKES